MLKPNSIILFQGDSITDCGRDRNVHGAVGTGYPYFVAAQQLADRPADKLQFLNRGVAGNRIVDLYARIQSDVINLKPDLLSVLIGVNDAWHENSVPVPEYRRIYADFLIEVQAALPGIRLVLCEPFVLPCGVGAQYWSAGMAERRAVVKKLSREFNTAFVPFQAMFDDAVKQAPPAHWAHDGVHPTPAGHQLMAREWLKNIE